MASGPTITLGGGFSPINGMEFLGQSEAKGNALTKCQSFQLPVCKEEVEVIEHVTRKNAL